MRPGPARTLQLASALPSGVRIPELDRLKGLAMVLVLFYHGGGALGYDNALHGEVGVDVFLIVSGVLLGLNSYGLSVGEFLKRRLLRIYPTYWIALGLFLYLNSKYYGDNRSPADIWLHIAGLHGFSRPEFFSDISDSFWFISVIVLLYAVFIILRRRLHDLAFVVGIGCLLTLAICSYYQHTASAGGLSHLGVRVPTVFLGIILGQIASGRPLAIRFTPLCAVGVLTVVYLCFFRGLVFVYPLAALAWITAFLAADRWLRRRRPGRVLLAGFSFLGVYSYEIYLLHQPLIRDYNRLVLFDWWQIAKPTPAELWLSMAAAFALVIPASVLLHKATEFLFRSLRKRPAA